MSKAHRVLVVGAGTMGANYARMISADRVPGAELAGVVDIDRARAEAVAGEAGAPAYEDLGEAIQAAGATVAYVATPDALHRQPAERLAAAGIHLLVEKPLATTVEDAAAMVDAVRASAVHAEVNYSNRWNPPFVEAHRTIASGELGMVRSFNVCLNNRINSPRDNLAWSRATSPAWFLMSHCLDLASWLGGRRAERIYATGGRGRLAALGIDTWDWIHALISYEGGGDGVFESSWILPESWPAGIEFRFRVSGTEGSIVIDNTLQNIAVAAGTYRHPGTLAWAPQRLGAFLRAVDGQAGTRVRFEEGLETTRTLVAIHRSLETGQPERP